MPCACFSARSTHGYVASCATSQWNTVVFPLKSSTVSRNKIFRVKASRWKHERNSNTANRWRDLLIGSRFFEYSRTPCFLRIRCLNRAYTTINGVSFFFLIRSLCKTRARVEFSFRFFWKRTCLTTTVRYRYNIYNSLLSCSSWKRYSEVAKSARH